MKSAIESSSVAVETQPETWATDALSTMLRKKVDDNPPKIYERSEAQKDRSVRSYYETARASRVESHVSGAKIEDVFDLRDNPYGRKAPFSCRFVYQNLISTQLDLTINPCCYMSHVPGHRPMRLAPDVPFMTVWNSDALVNLRRRLRQGPLFQACATCPMQG
jgi:hypothetical protein